MKEIPKPSPRMVDMWETHYNWMKTWDSPEAEAARKRWDEVWDKEILERKPNQGETSK